MQVIAFARDCTFECGWNEKDFLTAVRMDGVQAAMVDDQAPGVAASAGMDRLSSSVGGGVTYGRAL
jgi:hypothetical protein